MTFLPLMLQTQGLEVGPKPPGSLFIVFAAGGPF